MPAACVPTTSSSPSLTPRPAQPLAARPASPERQAGGQASASERCRPASRNRAAVAASGNSQPVPDATVNPSEPSTPSAQRPRLEAEAAAHAGLVAVAARDHDRAVGAAGDRPLVPLADPDRDHRDRRPAAAAPLGQRARRQPRRLGVRGPADVAADDADAGPDHLGDRRADARQPRRRAGRGQHSGHDRDEPDVLDRALAGGGVSGGRERHDDPPRPAPPKLAPSAAGRGGPPAEHVEVGACPTACAGRVEVGA